MHGCLAPSEIPRLRRGEYTAFGHVAERIVADQYRRRYAVRPADLFLDDYNRTEYRRFLQSHNPRFDRAKLDDYLWRVHAAGYKQHVPDLLVDTPTERAFYEVKPDSVSGRSKGRDKVGVLSATFMHYGLRYEKGMRFQPKEQLVAWLGDRVKVWFRPRLAGPGLIVYRLCLESDGVIEWATLAAVLRYVVRRLNERPKADTLRPLDLAPGLRGLGLADLARVADLPAMVVASPRAEWRHLWKAVLIRFAIVGTAAAVLAAATGPLLVGELVAAGLALWVVFDVIRYHEDLWWDAERLARQGA